MPNFHRNNSQDSKTNSTSSKFSIFPENENPKISLVFRKLEIQNPSLNSEKK